MLKKINNFTLKSFYDYNGPEENFDLKNIIFGYNGKGKTSLSYGIVEEFFKDNNKKNENIRFFNNKYVEENLLIEEEHKTQIKSVVANFGKKSVENRKEIYKLKNDIVDIKNYELEINEIEKKIIDEYEQIFNRKKGNTKILNPHYLNVQELFSKYEKLVDDAKKIENNLEELSKITGDNSLEDLLIEKKEVLFNKILLTKDEDIEKMKKILLNNYDNSHIPSSEVVDWLNEGLKIHKNHKICEFCGNNINLENIKVKIQKYNKDEKQKANQFLISFRNNLENYIEHINNFFLNNYKSYEKLFNFDLSKYFENFNKIVNNLLSFIDLINNKLKEITNIINVDTEELKKDLNNINSNIEDLNNLKNNDINNLEKKINKFNILLKGSIGLELIVNPLIKEKKDLLIEKIKNIEEIKEKNNILNKKIKELENNQSNKIDFAVIINEILNNLDVGINLELTNNNYTLKNTKMDKELEINDISDGEKNLLAILYFYIELFEDINQTEVKKNIELVVIDDPISSVDDLNKMYILSILKEILSYPNYQLFILTHVWDDFCNLSYTFMRDEKVSLFEVKKSNNKSYVQIIKNKKIKLPYKYDFKEIYDFSKENDISNLSKNNYFYYPNVMRRIIEHFLSFKYSEEVPANSKNFNKIKKILLFKSDNPNDKKNLEVLLNVCNIYSHKYQRNPNEILSSAKFLMKVIKNVDENHFNENKQ
ncbi:AAA family ATPase [Spiroplasma tabanidicola]|uniref:Protein CR006 P-loop domain-containing protein n=1 Tax=Spiroplasma tabanidicola TaxID=324079 RepID=A0A6I6C7X4_9MOLU|nr:AAA family ATPase [Spiroplasma tabanidicola]QGS51866.1 hypothetical protein STABA_v1c05030 [Spiroplasma tabanidicola]